MLKLKKRLVVALCCSICFFANAQKDSVKNITIDLGKNYKYSLKPAENTQNILDYLAKIGPLLALLGIWFQISIRQKDDRLKNQLDRLNRQISEFYGPLFSLYETGHRNFYSYLTLFGEDVTFKNPNYKDWVYTVFQPTNKAMEEIIINKADLILGKKIPDCFLQFCKWSATMKVYTEAQLQSSFDKDRWESLFKKIPHPEIKMQAYLNASFEVLKEEQSKHLSGKKSKPSFHEKRKKLSDKITEVLSSEINKLLPEEKSKLLSGKISELLVEEKSKVISSEKCKELSDKIAKLLSEQIGKLLSEEKAMLLAEEVSKLLSEEKGRLLSEEISKLLPKEKCNMLTEEISNMLTLEINNQLSEKINRLLLEEKSGLLPEEENKTLCDKISKLLLEEKELPPEKKSSLLFRKISNLSLRKKKDINEDMLIKEIDRRAKLYVNSSKRSDTWENEIWKNIGSNMPVNLIYFPKNSY